MSKMKVDLVDSMGSDISVVNSARVSFNKESEYKTKKSLAFTREEGGDVLVYLDEDLLELEEKDFNLLNYLAKHKHLLPFRHPQLSFRCKAPLFVARQLGKHQVGMSWSEVSRRYITDGIEFFEFDNYRYKPDGSIKQGSGKNVSPELEEAIRSVEDDYLSLAKELYSKLNNLDIAPEQARAYLPQTMMVEWIWTGSLLSFFHLFKERTGEGAQQETKDFAYLLKEQIPPELLVSWAVLEDFC